MQNEKILPQWAPRVPQSSIRRLYQNDAQGIYDPDLIDAVGYALRSRCQSFLDAMAAVQGRAPCPRCNQIVYHNQKRETLLHCECGWMLTWEDYFATIQHKQLSGAEPVVQLFEQFVTRFPTAHTPRDKVILIDQLLHGFHWYHKHGYTRPVAVNLIGGRLAEVIEFLDNLSYGPASTPGTQDTYAEWKHNSQNLRTWALKGRQAPEE